MSRKAALSILLGLSAAAPLTTLSAEDSKITADRYISILGTYTFADDERSTPDLDYATGLHLIYGGRFGESRFGWETGFQFANYETGSAVAVDNYRYGLGLDLTWSFGDRHSFTPYLLAGVEANYNDVLPDTEDDWDFGANVGLGFVTGPVFKHGQVRLRGEARYAYDNFQDGYGEPRVALGIEIPLFLADRFELAAAPVAEVQVVQVPTGLLDSDGDGVVDERDRCPNTPAGVRVDGDGCPLERVTELRGVTFEFNKTRLRPDSVTILDWVLGVMRKHPDLEVELSGHTDNIGGADYNQKLSEGRAQSVKDYIVGQGIDSNRLSVRGYGASEPRYDNSTEEGRERNRRVELRILN